MCILSICIPTFNRAKYLPELLDSIIGQLDGPELFQRVEIVVNDNASTDNTEQLVADYQIANPNLRLCYFKNDSNIGFDLNMLKVVERATGQYCWFMGSDDKLTSGAIDIVLEAVKTGSDLYMGDRVETNINMIPLRRDFMFSSIDRLEYDFCDPVDFERYFEDARSLASIFGYLSNIIFLRSKWNRAVSHYQDCFTGSAFGFLFVLMTFREYGCLFKYIPKPIVFCRTGNDTTFNPNNSFIKRFMLDVDGYTLLVNKLFRNDAVGSNGFKLVFRKQFYTRYYFYIRSSAGECWQEIESKLRFLGFNNSFLYFLRYGKFFCLAYCWLEVRAKKVAVVKKMCIKVRRALIKSDSIYH